MDALFLKLVNLSITASWLILAVLLLRLLLKKAPKWIPCLLWGFVALRLVCPFSIETDYSLIPSSQPLPADIIYTATPQIQSGVTAIDNVVNPILSATLTADPVASVNPTQIWSFILSHVWLIGMVGMMLYALGSFLLLKHRMATATILRDNIKQSEQVDSPFVLGFICPTIYLPYQIDEADIHHVIAHEQAHIRRRDHLWKPVGFLLLSVYWFNPLIWVSYILLCRDIEIACDEKVIKEMEKDDRRAYSTALLNCSVHRRRIAACPLAFGEVSVKDRVRNVMNYRKPAFWFILLAVITCIVVALCLLTDPKTDDSSGGNGITNIDSTDIDSTWNDIADSDTAGNSATDNVADDDTAANDSAAADMLSEPNGTESALVVQTYWTISVEDYEVSLQDGTAENTLEVWVKKADREWTILTFEDYDYRTPEDISADTFEDILGHNGFIIYQYFPYREKVDFCSKNYFALDEEPIYLANSCGGYMYDNANDYPIDVDGDGIKELVCNVQWLADGAVDTWIYHWNGESVEQYAGTDLMLASEPAFEINGVSFTGSEYLPEKNKILAWHWDEESEGYIEKEYDIDLDKLKKWYNEAARTASSAAYTAEEAITIVQEQLILAYENIYGEFIPSDVQPSAIGTSDEEYLAYIIPRLEVREETASYYVIPVIWDFWVDKQTGEVVVHYNGIDDMTFPFDPMSENALGFAG